jgi:hypothetical protein
MLTVCDITGPAGDTLLRRFGTGVEDFKVTRLLPVKLKVTHSIACPSDSRRLELSDFKTVGT